MDSSLPPFGIRRLRDGEPFSILQIDEKQYQSIIEPHPQATLTYTDEDDGEDVTVGSGIELRQRLEESPVSTAPLIHCYDKVKDEKQDRYIHLFDIQRTNSCQSIWREHALAYRRATKTFDKAQKAHKDNCDSGSISSIDLNSDRQGHHEALTRFLAGDISEKSDTQPESQAQPVALSDAIPSLVENLANLLQTTSETLRKAAEKSRESQTSPIEDVLSGVSNIVTEIGSFGLSLLDSLNDSTEDVEASTSDVSHNKSITDSMTGGTVENTDQASTVTDDRSDSNQNTPVDSSTNDSTTGEARCRFCSLAQLPCRPWSELATTCGNCMTLGQSCTLSPSDTQIPSPVSPAASKYSDAVSPSSKDGSILDQDTEDADFSRRYPPLMSLRRANTIAGLHSHFTNPNDSDSDNKGLHRHNSWVNRYPHRPTPHVLDAETYRRRNFARDCFPTQTYTPSSGTQETVLAPTWHYMKPKLHQNRYTAQPVEDPRDAASHKQFEATPAATVLPNTSDIEAAIDVKSARPSVAIDSHQIKTGPLFEYHPSSTEIAPVSAEERNTTIEPLAESSGAFFHRMMRDNPSRRQNHAPETNERLNRHRSYSRQRPNNNPFSNLNRSHTVSSATNPASRLNRPFDPFYPVAVPADPVDAETVNLEAKTMQNGMNTSAYGTSEPPRCKIAQRPHSLHRPFSPVWEEHLNQIKVHKDQISRLDRNGESSSMYSPPPRHMRSVPNFAVSVPAPSMSQPTSITTGISPLVLPNSHRQPITRPTANRNSLPAPIRDQPRPNMSQQLPSHQAPRQPLIPPYPKMDLNPFTAAAVYAPLPKSKYVQTQIKTPKETTSNDAITNCLSALRDMGYGLGDKNLKSRLHVYAEAAGGDVMEAVDMIEQDKRANSETAESDFD